MTAGIVEILSGLSVAGWNAGEVYEDFYIDLADQLTPDAGVMGISVYAKGALGGQQKVLNSIAEALNNFKTDLFDFPPDLPTSASLTVGGILGFEGLVSFGSSQLGAFWYRGIQAEAQASSSGVYPISGGLDFNMYTGYVWNLWNCDDYTGWFMSGNTPFGSYFFDPEDKLMNLGPWGFSRSLGGWSVSAGTRPDHGSSTPNYITSTTTLAGFNGTFYRYALGKPEIVSYGKLALVWGVAQVAAFTQAALRGNHLSAASTGFGLLATGAIAKSKEVYNRSALRTTSPAQTLHTWRSSNVRRPPEKINFYRNDRFIEKNYWRSGPRPFWSLVSLAGFNDFF